MDLIQRVNKHANEIAKGLDLVMKQATLGLNEHMALRPAADAAFDLIEISVGELPAALASLQELKGQVEALQTENARLQNERLDVEAEITKRLTEVRVEDIPMARMEPLPKPKRVTRKK